MTHCHPPRPSKGPSHYRMILVSSLLSLLPVGHMFAQVPPTAESAEPEGLVFEGAYKADHFRVLDGGMRRGGATMGHLDLKVTANLDKLLTWKDATAVLNLLHNHGGKINADYTGSMFGVSNIEVPVPTHRVFQAWMQKNWNNDRLSLLVGLYPIDSEFQVLDSAALFLQPPYGPTSELSQSRGPSIFNNSAFGVRFKWTSEDGSFYVQSAVLDGMPGDPDHPKGTHIKFGDGDGTMQIAEFGVRSANTTAADNGPGGGGNKYALGYWRYTSKVDDLVDVNSSGNPLRRRSHGIYALVDQSLWRGAKESELRGFLRVSATDGHSTAIQNTISTGVTLAAPFANRPLDTVGVAYTRAKTGARYRAAQRSGGVLATPFESAWELTYHFKATPQLAVHPAVQNFRYPGADQAVASATLLGVRLELNF